MGKGGAERVLLTTLSEFVRQGHSCTVLALYAPYTMQQEFEEAGITVKNLHLKHRWCVLEALKGIRVEVGCKSYDIIHAHLFFAHLYTGLLKRFFLPGLKTVVTLHNMGYDADPAIGMIKKLRKKLDGWILRQAFQRKIAVSNAVKESFERNLDIKGIEVIANGFMLDEMRAANAITASPRSSNLFTFITPGRLVKEKGHRYLIDAVAELNREFKNIRFIFAGSGPLNDDLRNQAASVSAANIDFVGSLPQSDLFNEIAKADAVVIPSLSEGFPMVVGEAMALGKAVVTTNAGGIPDLIDQNINGIMVNPADAEALAGVLRSIIKDETLRTRLGESAAKKSEQFDINYTSMQIMNIYRELV